MMKNRNENKLPAFYHYLPPGQKQNYQINTMFASFIDGTIAYNDLYRLIKAVMKRERFRSLCLFSLRMQCDYFSNPATIDSFDPGSCVAGCFKCKKFKFDWPGFSGTMDKGVEMEMLLDQFKQVEISMTDMRRLFAILLEDDEEYEICNFYARIKPGMMFKE